MSLRSRDTDSHVPEHGIGQSGGANPMKALPMAFIVLLLLVGRVGAQLPSAVVTDGLGVNIHMSPNVSTRHQHDPGFRLQVRARRT